jgi:hypothetical protein
MTYSLTGISYVVLFISLSFLTFRFFQYWQQKRDVTSRLFLLFGLALTSFALIRTVSLIFFIYNTQILRSSITWVAISQSVTAAIMAYLIFHLKLPRISPWVGFFLVLMLGSVATFVSTSIPYEPVFNETEKFLDWGGPSGEFGILYPLLRMAVVLVAFLPLTVIFFQQFLHSENIYTKRRSLGLSLILLLGIGLGFIDFVLNNLLSLKAAIYRDYVTMSVGFLIFLVVLLTQKVEKSGTRVT